MINKIKWFLTEILNTFSNKKSFFSSKRIERFLVFITMLTLTIVFVTNSIIACSITAVDIMLIVGTWLGYGGWSTVQINKDKEADKENGKPIKDEKEILNG